MDSKVSEKKTYMQTHAHLQSLESYVDPDYYKWCKQLDNILDKLVVLRRTIADMESEIDNTPTSLYRCNRTHQLAKKLRRDRNSTLIN